MSTIVDVRLLKVNLSTCVQEPLVVGGRGRKTGDLNGETLAVDNRC